MHGGNRVLRILGRYACLDTAQRRKVNRMKWNDIPYDESATPEVKALEFDLQAEENAREANDGEVSE